MQNSGKKQCWRTAWGAGLPVLSAAVMLMALPSQAQTAEPAADLDTAEAVEEAAAVPAQEENSLALGTITVTAQRRAESAQSVPISVNVMNTEQLTAAGVTDTTLLAGRIPGLSIYKQPVPTYFMRGLGTTGSGVNAEPSISTYIDGVYVYGSWGTFPATVSAERVEVLKGPQGTLFGRNTTGGVIQIVTRDPMAAPTLEANIGYANYDTVSASAYGSVALSEKLGVSLAFDARDQGKGWGRNITRDEETFFSSSVDVQGKAVYQPADETRITAFGWYSTGDSSGFNQQNLEGTAGIDGVYRDLGRYEVAANTPDSQEYNSALGYLRVDQELPFADLVSITSYRNSKAFLRLDGDLGTLTFVDALINYKNKAVTQELQLQSKGDGPLTWVVGAYYFDGSAAADPIIYMGGSGGPTGVRTTYREQLTDSLAAFGQVSAQITADTKLTVGLRYTDETQELPGGVSTFGDGSQVFTTLQEIDSSGWTGRVALDHNFTPDIMGYVSYNRGLKSGGGPTNGGSNGPTFDPETVNAYEIGLKTMSFNNRLMLNMAGFYYDFSDIQINQQNLGLTQIVNAAGAELYGVEFDFQAYLTERLQVYGGASFLEGEYVNYRNATAYDINPAGGARVRAFDGSGYTTVYTPGTSFSFGLDYNIPTSTGEFNADAAFRYVGEQFVSPSNQFALPEYTTLDVGLSWADPGDTFAVRLWARNLLDEEYFQSRAESGVGYIQSPAAPRTYGITLSAKY